jgi:hypothetical protein
MRLIVANHRWIRELAAVCTLSAAVACGGDDAPPPTGLASGSGSSAGGGGSAGNGGNGGTDRFDAAPDEGAGGGGNADAPEDRRLDGTLEAEVGGDGAEGSTEGPKDSAGEDGGSLPDVSSERVSLDAADGGDGDVAVADHALDAPEPELDAQQEAESGIACPPLIGYWPADGDAKDAVGRNDGQLNDGVTFVAGKAGSSAFAFNGTSSVTMDRAPGVRSSGNFSYSFFIYVTAYTNGIMTDGAGSYFIDRPADSAPLMSFKAIDGAYGVQVRCDDFSGPSGPVGGVIEANVWTHLAFVRTAKSQLTLYVNGQQAASIPDFCNFLTPPPFKLGRHAIEAGFTGRIDELRVYDAALTQPQVEALASGRPCN